MSRLNVLRDMTPDGETPGLKGVSNATGEEIAEDVHPKACYDASTLKPLGRVEADVPEDKNIRCNLWKNEIKLGTWNVRTMDESRLEILTRELDRTKVDLVGISEMRWTGKGHFTSPSDHVVYYSGKDTKKEHGVALVVNSELAKCVLGYNPVSERIITLRIQGAPMNITVVQAYAPTSASDEDTIESFYSELQQTIDSIPGRDIMIITGDFNAKVGSKSTNKQVMGNFGLGEQNVRGERLIEFCQDNKCAILNTFFKQHPRRLYTWTSPGNNIRNQIDYIIVQNRWKSSFKAVKTLPGADCGSDHQLLVSIMKFRIRRVKRQRKPVRYDVSEINDQYRVEVKNKFLTLLEQDSEETTPEELWEDVKHVVNDTAQATLPRQKRKKSPWTSKKVLELADQRREVKASGLDNSESVKKYRALSREIKQQMRRDKNDYISSKCMEIEKHSEVNNTRDMFKNIKSLTKKAAPKLNVLKDENGNILTEDEEIKARWKEYCGKLYASKETEEEEEDVDVRLDDDHILEPSILYSEVKNAVNHLRKGKAPGIDNIPAELIKESGEEGLRVMHMLCNKIWQQKAWPKDWKRAIFLPLPKKGDTRECANNRTISLIPHASKILLHIIADRIRNHLENELPPEQAGFRKGRGTRNQIGNLRNLMEKSSEFQQPLYLCFIDYSKAFDCVQHKKLWKIMSEMGFPAHIIQLIQSLYEDQEATVRTENGDTEWFTIGQGVRQGCILSPYLFNIYAEYIMRKAFDDFSGKVSVGGRAITNLRYADDTTLIASSAEELLDLIIRVKVASEQYGLYLNVKKTKIMICGDVPKQRIVVDGEEVDQVDTFNFLGSLIVKEGGSSAEIKRRLAMAKTSASTLSTIWKDNDITRATKIGVMRALVFPVALYGCETWAVGKADRKMISSFEMWCWRKLLGITWKDHITNEYVKSVVGDQPPLVSRIDKHKLQYFGHICRRSGDNLEKIIIQGTFQGSRKRGRPKLRWSDGLKEITGNSLNALYRLTSDRCQWKNLITWVTTGQS